MSESVDTRNLIRHGIPAAVYPRLAVIEILKLASVSKACSQTSESLEAWAGIVLTYDSSSKDQNEFPNDITSMSSFMLESLSRKLMRVGKNEGVATVPPHRGSSQAKRSPLNLRKAIFGETTYWWLAYNTEEFGWFERDHTTTYPTGLKVWAPCPLLCRWFSPAVVLQTSYAKSSWDRSIQGRSVLELGSGIGMLGVVLARNGASRVVITDVNSCARRVASINVAINAAFNASVERLVYGREAAIVFRSTFGRFDTIVGADIVYSQNFIKPIFESVDELLTERGSFLLGFVERDSALAEDLSRASSECGFELSASCLLAETLNAPKVNENPNSSNMTGMLAEFKKVLDNLPKGGSAFGEDEEKVQLLQYRRFVMLNEMD